MKGFDVLGFGIFYKIFYDHKIKNYLIALLKKWSFSLRSSSVNVTKSAANCRFSHICWRNHWWITSISVQCQLLWLIQIFLGHKYIRIALNLENGPPNNKKYFTTLELWVVLIKFGFENCDSGSMNLWNLFRNTFDNNVPFAVKCFAPRIDWLLFILGIHSNISFSGFGECHSREIILTLKFYQCHFKNIAMFHFREIKICCFREIEIFYFQEIKTWWYFR